MARFCSKCNKKFGFFEEDFNGMCKSCYDKSVEEERIRLQKEKEEKRRKQEQEEQERIKRQEEEKRKQEEARKRQEKEEQERIKKQQEEKLKEENIKYNQFKNKFMNNAQAIQFFLSIIEKLENNLFYNIFKEEDKHERYIADAITLFIKNIIYMLPQDFKLEDLKKVDSDKKCLDIIEKNKDILNIEEYLVQIYNYKTNEEDTPLVECFEEDIYIYNTELLEEQIIESEKHNESMRKYYEYAPYGVSLLSDYEVIYSWAIIFIYNVVLLQYLEIFKKSELNQIYCKLKQNTDDILYVVEKIYDIYIQLYKDIFDTVLSKNQIYAIIMSYLYENINNSIKDYIETALNKKNQVELINKFKKNMTVTDKYKMICENVLNTEIFKQYFSNEFCELEDGIVKELTVTSILNIVLNKYNLIDDVDILSINELEKLRNSTIDIIETIQREKQLENAKQERDRILKGDFSKEKEMQKQSVEYSNVQNGYEFEQYVADLYKKLGYKIEEVTKKSGDQRSRCYCL